MKLLPDVTYLQLFDPGQLVDRQELEKRCTAAKSGTGPAGETCGSCQHICRTGNNRHRVYFKCGLMRSDWTKGEATDIKYRWPACELWESKYEQPD